MATLTFKGESYTVDHAVKGDNYVHGYDANGVCVVAFENVGDLSAITYSGTYMAPENCAEEVFNKVVYCGGKLQTQGGGAVKVGATNIANGAIYRGYYGFTLAADAWTLNDSGTYEQIKTMSGVSFTPENHVGFLGFSRGLQSYPGDGTTNWSWSQASLKADKKKMACLYSAKLIAENSVKFVAAKIPDGALNVTIIFLGR